MNSYRISKEAKNDLLEIARYTILNWSFRQSRIYKEGLEDCFQTLASARTLGCNASKFAEGLRMFPYKSHMIFYQPEVNGIVIVRVLSQQMDYHQHL